MGDWRELLLGLGLQEHTRGSLPPCRLRGWGLEVKREPELGSPHSVCAPPHVLPRPRPAVDCELWTAVVPSVCVCTVPASTFFSAHHQPSSGAPSFLPFLLPNIEQVWKSPLRRSHAAALQQPLPVVPPKRPGTSPKTVGYEKDEGERAGRFTVFPPPTHPNQCRFTSDPADTSRQGVALTQRPSVIEIDQQSVTRSNAPRSSSDRNQASDTCPFRYHMPVRHCSSAALLPLQSPVSRSQPSIAFPYTARPWTTSMYPGNVPPPPPQRPLEPILDFLGPCLSLLLAPVTRQPAKATSQTPHRTAPHSRFPTCFRMEHWSNLLSLF
ncbi:hypothetical protein K456DRAFT_41634 [Colletotrichum gloeosporioides 23]|nr:hypothetical protein K456DRAFT_41634 [Colletotrichum gloeosporioides 23]